MGGRACVVVVVVVVSMVVGVASGAVVVAIGSSTGALAVVVAIVVTGSVATDESVGSAFNARAVASATAEPARTNRMIRERVRTGPRV